MSGKSSHINSAVSSIFTSFHRKTRLNWELFALVDFYMPQVLDAVTKKQLSSLEIDTIRLDAKRRVKVSYTQGIIQSMQTKHNPRRTLIEIVSHFEHYMSELAFVVYRDMPRKLLGKSGIENTGGSSKGDEKLIKIIIDSKDKDEILHRIAEERIRSIFYGNPLDVFEKDKADLGFADYFKSNCQKELTQYQEITARRNIVIHNDGRIDRKYARETKTDPTRIGEILDISKEYLSSSIIVIEDLGALSAMLILKNIYNYCSPSKKLAESLESYAKRNKKDYKRLISTKTGAAKT